MLTTKNFQKSILAVAAVALGLCLTAQPVSAAAYDEVYSFAQVAGTTGSTKNFGAAVDGDTVYFSLNSSPNITKVDASGTSVLLSTADWTLASNGATSLTSQNAFESMGDYLVFGESSADQVWKVDKTSGAVSAIATQDAIKAVTGQSSVTMLSYKGAYGDDYYFYEGASDSILKVNVSTEAVSTVVSNAQLAGFMDPSQVNAAIAFDSAGDLYFGDSTTTVDGIVKWDGSTGSTVLTLAEITAVTGQSSVIHGDLLFGEDGLMYFHERKSAGVLSFDPADAAATLQYVLTSDQLLAGPMGSTNISSLVWYDGKLAFTGMSECGFYTVPEPTILGLVLSLVGFALLRRRSK